MQIFSVSTNHFYAESESEQLIVFSAFEEGCLFYHMTFNMVDINYKITSSREEEDKMNFPYEIWSSSFKAILNFGLVPLAKI